MSASDPLAGPPGSVAGPMVFDRRVLEDMFGAERAVVAAVLATFLGSVGTSLAPLRGAVPANLDLAADLAHRIKGAARMSGALALGQAAQWLEEVARSGDAVGAQAGMGQLDLQWQALQDDPVLGSLAGMPTAAWN